jgi:hypothetical protein
MFTNQTIPTNTEYDGFKSFQVQPDFQIGDPYEAQNQHQYALSPAVNRKRNTSVR